MTSHSEDVVMAAAICVVLSSNRKKAPKKRRFWVRPSLQARKKYSGSDLLTDLKHDDRDLLAGELKSDGSFRNFLRMTSTDFEYLITSIGPRIARKDTSFRDAIPVQERLAITLRFLATGDSYRSLSYLFKVAPPTISAIIPVVCDALIDTLQDFIKVPCKPEEWVVLAEEFHQKWNFPNCMGSIDGKHIALQAPIGSSSEFFNYKGYFSIVLMAVVDAHYCFTYVNAGCQGRLSDGGVFGNCHFKKMLDKGQLNLPAARDLPGRTNLTPFIFVADDAFPLLPHLMKPYPGVHAKGSKERIYNGRLSRARIVVENVFGIMSVVFRVLRKPMLLQPEKATKVVLTCAFLHNFLRKSDSLERYNPPGTYDTEECGEVIPGSWRVEGLPTDTLLKLKKVARKPSTLAYQNQNEFCSYFMSNIGQVSWQHKY